MRNALLILVFPALILLSCGQKETSPPPKRVKRVNLDSLVRNAPTLQEVMESMSPEMRKKAQKVMDSMSGSELQKD